MNIIAASIGILVSLSLAPLLPGIINRVKAFVAGRQGIPLFQLYYDLAKLLRKRSVYSKTISPLFRLGPCVTMACSLAAFSFMPLSGVSALVAFPGDFFFLIGLMALGRFSMMLAALDTGSAFEGMGTAREALFSAMAEPILLTCFAVLVYATGKTSLSGIFSAITVTPPQHWPFFFLMAAALFLVMLVECSRMPVDDVATHLELTMIHEVMVLDHSGPDLALVHYASCLKMWIFGLLLGGILLPFPLMGTESTSTFFVVTVNMAAVLAVPLVMAFITGIIESTMARFKLLRVPQIITVASALIMLAALSIWR